MKKATVREVPLKERDELEPILVSDPSIIEDSLTVIQNQFPTSDGWIDILAVDQEGAAVVVELKDEEDPLQLNQGIRYYDWVRTNIAWLSRTFKQIDADQPPRLILIAPSFPDELVLAARYSILNDEGLLTLRHYHGLLLPDNAKTAICSDVDIGEPLTGPEIPPTIEQKANRIETKDVRGLFLRAISEATGIGIQLKPLGGSHATGWYKGKRFLWLGARKKWFVWYLKHMNGDWSETYQIATAEKLEKAIEEAKIIINEIDEKKSGS